MVGALGPNGFDYNPGLQYNPEAANKANPLAGFSDGYATLANGERLQFGGVPLPVEQYQTLTLPPEQKIVYPPIELPTFNLDFGTLPPLGPLDLSGVKLDFGTIAPLGNLDLSGVKLDFGTIAPLGNLDLSGVKLDFGTIAPLGNLDLSGVKLDFGTIAPNTNFGLGDVRLDLGTVAPLGNLDLSGVKLDLGTIGQLPKLDLGNIQQQLANLTPAQLALVQTQVQNGTFDVGSLSNGTLGNLNSSTSAIGSSASGAGKLGVKINPGDEVGQRANLEPILRKYAIENGVDPDVVVNLVTQESKWNPVAKSEVGALGLGQFMPGTAKQYGLTDRTAAIPSLKALTLHIKDLYKEFGSYRLALAAYNAGPGAVTVFKNGTYDKELNPRSLKTDGVPPWKETQNYVKIILGDVNA
jgi:hypothetical protein